MKTIRLSLMILAVFALFAAFALPTTPVSAATARTYTITETQINSAFRVTNPRNRRVTSMSVDLQPGQASVTSVLNDRRGNTTTIVSVWQPVVSSGKLSFNLISVTTNGTALDQQYIDAFNNTLAKALRNAIQARLARLIAGPFTVDSITISDNDVTLNVTLTGRGR